MGQKVIIRFWVELLPASRNQLTTLCRPFAHYACLRLRSTIVHFIRNNCLYFVCYGWSAQTSPKRWFGKHEYDVNYDVTNNGHKIQITPCATEWTPPHQNFLRTPLVAAHRRWLSKGVIDTVSWLSQSTDIFTKFDEVNLQLQGNGFNLIKAKSAIFTFLSKFDAVQTKSSPSSTLTVSKSLTLTVSNF